MSASGDRIPGRIRSSVPGVVGTFRQGAIVILLDILFLLLTAALFAASFWYQKRCEHL